MVYIIYLLSKLLEALCKQFLFVRTMNLIRKFSKQKIHERNKEYKMITYPQSGTSKLYCRSFLKSTWNHTKNTKLITVHW